MVQRFTDKSGVPLFKGDVVVGIYTDSVKLPFSNTHKTGKPVLAKGVVVDFAKTGSQGKVYIYWKDYDVTKRMFSNRVYKIEENISV